MLHFKLSPAACRVVGIWFFLPGAVAAPFLFWQSFALGAVFFVSWCVLSLWIVPAHLHTVEGSLSLGELRVNQGILFKLARRVPTRFISGSTRMASPLLRWCGCCLVILYTSSSVVVLPGLADADADRLLHALGEARL